MRDRNRETSFISLICLIVCYAIGPFTCYASQMARRISQGILRSGVIISVADGVLSLQGFLTAFCSEVFRVSGSSGNAGGILVNLYRNETMNLLIGGLLFDPGIRVGEGAKVNSTNKLPGIRLGDFVFSSILDPLGKLILNSGRIDCLSTWIIECPAPRIIDRESVFEALQTGLICIDAMIPIGRGQRELILGDRQTGKTCIGLDTILNQKYKKVFCVYVPVGQKASSILQLFLALIRKDGTFYLSMLVASATSSGVCQYLSVYTGSALCEYYMLSAGIPCFLMLDDLSRHAMSYREIYLLLRRPPGREAYPGEIFFVHSRVLERSAKLSSSLGAGSITCFPVIQTLAGDVSAYISTNVISITDGQIFLSNDLFLGGIKPGVDIGLSVTRVGSAGQTESMKVLAGIYKVDLAQLVELQSFSQFVADLGEETKARLTKGRSLVEILKQYSGSPMNLRSEIGVLSIANQDLLKSLSIEEVQPFLNLYLSVPAWVFLYVPVRLVGISILKCFYL